MSSQQTPVLYRKSDGKEINIGDKLQVVHGVNKSIKDNNTIVVGEIIPPTDDNKLGLIRFNVSREGMPSYSNYFPYVVGCAFR
jgi:hypothetical protein